MVVGTRDCDWQGKDRLCLQKKGDGGCLELFLAPFLIGRQSSGHNMSIVLVLEWLRLGEGAPRRSTNFDKGRTRAYCACRRCGFGVVRICFFSRLSLSLSLSLSHGWMTCDFTSFSTDFQLYQDDGRLKDGCVQWNSVYDCKYPRLKRGSNPGPLDKQVGA